MASAPEGKKGISKQPSTKAMLFYVMLRRLVAKSVFYKNLVQSLCKTLGTNNCIILKSE